MRNIDKKLFKKLSILYVEDDESTREEISFFLKKVCGNVTTAENGAEGLEAFRKENFDMIITDIQMPVMNGLDMVKEIRKTDQKIPIAVTTAFSDSDFLIKSISSGVDKYILKPIDMMELLTVIQKCTRTKALEHKIQSYDKYTHFLLRNNAKFMLIAHKGNLSYANKELMQLFNADSFTSLHEKSLFFYEEERQTQQKEWIRFVQENPQKKFIVTLENGTKHFSLEYKVFEEIEKSIFLFHEIKEEENSENSKEPEASLA